jgi:pimeloyl-ACP methyl ester carboxylesterase
MRWIGVATLCFLGGTIAVPSAQAQAVPPAGSATFVEGACKFKIGSGFKAGTNLRCGNLIVPENRTIANGRTIRLAVAMFQTPSPYRMPDPVVFLQGGPGGGIVQDLGPAITKKSAPVMLGNHDLILIDQRGTGLSRPLLTCPEVDKALANALQHGASVAAQNAAQTKAFATCRGRLTAKGIDVTQYTTAQNAADIADLRTALGLPTMDIYGVSYGTRLALELMRTYPTGIRSVALDSIVPPQFNIYTDAVAAEGHVFKALFAGCSRQASCARKYPHLKQTFVALLKRLNKHPGTFKARIYGSKQTYTVKLSGEGLAEFIRSAMYVTPLIRYLPRIITEINKGTYKSISLFFDIVAREGSSGIALGMYESTTCAEDAPYTDPNALTAAGKSLPKPIRTRTLREQAGQINACQAWNVPVGSPTLRQPVTSDIPTLLLEGEYDPITPPSNAQTVAATLTHAFSFLFPGTGHGVRYTSACVDSIVNTFFDDPSRAPNSSCIAKMKDSFA